MLKVAILSSWHVHAGGYAQEFMARDDVKVTAVWDEQPEKGQGFADWLKLPFEPDLDKLLATDIDSVCINSPTNEHPEVIIKCAKAGKHIFTEKVLALTNKEAQEIAAAVKAAGVKFCISFPHRTFRHNLFAKKVVDEKLLGDITYMRMRNAHNGASAGWLPPHFYSKEQCGGGAMIDLGAHPMYLIPWLMGKPVEVASAFTAVTGHGVEDNAVTVMKYANGAVAVSETGFVSSHSPTMLELYGTAGSLQIFGNEVRLVSEQQNEGKWQTITELPEGLPGPIDQFVDGVLYGKEIIFGMEDALVLTEMMDAAYRAHESGGFAKL